MTTKYYCMMCGSPDLVSYWHKNEPKSDGGGLTSANLVIRYHYPNAERCVDCGHVMPNGGRRGMTPQEQAASAQWIHSLLSDPAPRGAGSGEA